MDKSPEAFRTISEVAEGLDLPQHVLRFWESRFPQIKPLKRGGGRRYYRPDDVELLRAIKRLLYDEGYTIKGVQKMLREQGAGPLSRGETAPPSAPEPSARIEPAPPGMTPTPTYTGAAFAPATLVAPHVQSSASADDIAILRAALRDLREAERILAHARTE